MVDNVRVDIDVRKSAGSGRPLGSVRIADGKTGDAMQATDFGVMQIADRWGAFTARMRFSAAVADQWGVVIVDRGDPAAPGATHVSVLVDGRERMSAVLQ